MFKLITLLVSGIPAIIGALVAFMGRKMGTAAASIGAFVIITAGMILCINAILQSVLALMVVPPVMASLLGMFMPANLTACLAAIVSSKVCRAAYSVAKFKIVAINNAS